ncbi:tRNA(Met) cytidine acetyltransferase TmcA [Haloparvum sedimenti]|uniref:tRNA(Met) cytidine acetyltransferase TmcA n=1 Tax=Haloparvum sedimenti TaxID=1678448 RepID=UPI00071E81CD|nr:tRNA(Met) cytidine acetyltransferase TmcA [Haloparvum sedimenti]
MTTDGNAVADLAADLRAEAERSNERRVLVLAGAREAGIDAAFDAVAGAEIADDATTVVSTREGFRFDRVAPRSAGSLLGSTRKAVILDCHDYFAPNALGRVVGAVDGGGLLVLLTPPLDEWPAVRDDFDETLAVPPFQVDDVTGRFRERFVDTLRQHSGIGVVDVDAAPPTVERDGRTDPPERATGRDRLAADRAAPTNTAFPAAAYEACLTADQGRALRAFERLRTPGSAVVVESDRGRGKSSAAGLAAGSLAAEGRDVLVTAPAFRNAAEVFERARTLVDALGERAGGGGVEDDERATADDRRIETQAGGVVRFASPATAADLVAGEVGGSGATAPGDVPDAVIVDEAAAVPVRLLTRLLAARAVAFCTTVHGYEGAGRGFSVRFTERLMASDLTVTERRLEEPIRYARGDPVEGWAFRALMLDARPAVDAAVADATPEDAEYRTLDADDLLADEHLLGEAFGLLVLAHYRTEPNDLARLLDAPNLSVRALLFEGHVVAVDLLAREGDLPADLRASMYEGSRVRGNMVPDVLTSQLRDEDAGETRGLRTMRIATHPALRDSGFGSRLLEAVHDEFAPEMDYFGVGYGATPRLLRFWRRAGYRTVHVSTTRNDASGEYSAVMVRPESPAGEALLDRHAAALRDRLRDSLSDAHRDLDPDVGRAALRACPADPELSLSARDWRGVVGASYGPGMYDAAVGAFRDLALAHLLDREAVREGDLSPREERLLVSKVLQGHAWDVVADRLDYVSTGQCMRALGDAAKPLVDRYGDETAHAERDRFAE